MTMQIAYQKLEQHFAEWASQQPSIIAVIVVGSRARSDHAADDWSDLDLIVFTTAPDHYLHYAAWLDAFGTVVAAISSSFGQRDREWIALYKDSSKLDAAILAIDPILRPTLQAMVDTFPYPDVLQRGVRVLVDKTGTSSQLHLPEMHSLPQPNQAEFTDVLNQLSLTALKTAKFVRRGDIWRAKQLCDGTLKQHMLTLLEWHAALPPNSRDIWYDGRFLHEWADPQDLENVPESFAAFRPDDVQRALLATLQLCRRLALTIAAQLMLDYPAHVDHFIDQQIHWILES